MDFFWLIICNSILFLTNYLNFSIYKIMRYILFYTIFFFISALIVNADENFIEFENYSSIKDNFYPNDEGDKNEKKLVNYIEEFLEFHNVNYKKRKIENDTYITNSYNIEITLESSKKSEEEIIVICPLNPLIYQQEYQDNSLTIQIMLNLIKSFKSEKNNKGPMAIINLASPPANILP